jgi:hypothetical protein
MRRVPALMIALLLQVAAAVYCIKILSFAWGFSSVVCCSTTFWRRNCSFLTLDLHYITCSTQTGVGPSQDLMGGSFRVAYFVGCIKGVGVPVEFTCTCRPVAVGHSMYETGYCAVHALVLDTSAKAWSPAHPLASSV